ncbi:hypothetical protein ACJMK2_031708, partial [Sinanodonta woodiana]
MNSVIENTNDCPFLVQRLVLTTSSSALNAAPSAIKKQLPPAIVDGEACQLTRSTAVGKAQSFLKYRSILDSSLKCDTPSSFAMTVPRLEDDKHRLTFKKHETSKKSNNKSLERLPYTRDSNMCGLLEDYPSVYLLGSEASSEEVNLSLPDQISYYPYAKVKKGPRCTFANNNQFAFSFPDDECSDGYKMAHFTLENEPRNTFQNLEIVSESTIPVNKYVQGKDNTRNNYVCDAKDDDLYETCGNMKHMSCMEHVK